MDAIRRAKPGSVKGIYILSASLKTTMSPAIRFLQRHEVNRNQRRLVRGVFCLQRIFYMLTLKCRRQKGWFKMDQATEIVFVWREATPWRRRHLLLPASGGFCFWGDVGKCVGHTPPNLPI